MSIKEKKILVAIIALVLMLIVFLVGVFVYFNAENQTDKTNNNIIIVGENSEEQGESFDDPYEGDIEFDTPCGSLAYPQEWEGFVIIENVEENGGESIRFFSTINGNEKIHIFDLNFGVRNGRRLGLVETNNGVVDFYFEIFEIEFPENIAEEEKNRVYFMQEGLNELIAQLEIYKEDVVEEATAKEKVELETKFGKIGFETERKDNVHVEIFEDDEYIVRFYAKISGKEIVPVFDISFGEQTDLSLGEVFDENGNKKWLNVEIYEFTPNGEWISSEIDVVYSIQELLNEIVENLLK